MSANLLSSNPLSSYTVQALGWSLIHFLWQGALVALVLELALFALREHSSRLRYGVRCAALALMAALPVATFAWLTRASAGQLPAALPANLEQLLSVTHLTEAQLALLGGAGGGWVGWVVACWALGASLLAVRALRDYLRVRKLQRFEAGDSLTCEWQARFDRLARRMGVVAKVRVIDSAALAAPTVIGWLEPLVLIPARALSGLSTRELELVLAHELAHIRRHDYLVNLAQTALEALLFYHPAVWWVSNGIRAEREFCCDDAALDVSRDGVVYARALATLEGWRSTQPELGLSTLGGPLMTRIQRLLGVRPSSRPVRGPLSALCALLLVGGATAFAYNPAEPQDPDKLQALRKQIEVMERQIVELKLLLEEATVEAAPADAGHAFAWVVGGDDSEEPVVVELQSSFEGKAANIFTDDSGQTFSFEFKGDDSSEDVYVEKPHAAHAGKIKAVIEKLHGLEGVHLDNQIIDQLHEHVGKLLGEDHSKLIHEHVRKALGEHLKLRGDATFEIRIETGDGEAEVRKLGFFGKAPAKLESKGNVLFFDSKDEDCEVELDDDSGNVWFWSDDEHESEEVHEQEDELPFGEGKHQPHIFKLRRNLESSAVKDLLELHTNDGRVRPLGLKTAPATTEGRVKILMRTNDGGEAQVFELAPELSGSKLRVRTEIKTLTEDACKQAQDCKASSECESQPKPECEAKAKDKGDIV